MARMIRYIVFAVVYIAAGVALQFGLDAIYEQGSSRWIGHLIPIVSAPIAILAAWRFGQLAVTGLALSALICAFAVQMAIWQILHRVAVPAGGSVNFFSLYTVGGWEFALSSLWFVVCPILWHLLVFRGATTHAAASRHA